MKKPEWTWKLQTSSWSRSQTRHEGEAQLVVEVSLAHPEILEASPK
jgi:hypothetical protein